MKKFTYFALAFATVVAVTSCGPSEDKSTEKKEEQACMYSYDHASSVLEWTAFKFTEKTGVKGTFNTIEVKDGGAMEDPKDVIESLSFSIPVSSVETQNPERNGKIAQHFFGTIKTDAITGKVKALEDDGKAVLEITMNGITKDAEGTYTLENGNFAFHATIDVNNWNAKPGIDALNKICYDLHKGADGVSKLWSEVELSFTTTLKSDCE
jgi:polyisoprenoid-binding protein YceI